MPKKKDEPKGGWLMPPPTDGLKPLGVATKADKKGKWKFKPVKQTKKDRKLRKKWSERMAKADKKGKDRFKWPTKEVS